MGGHVSRVHTAHTKTSRAQMHAKNAWPANFCKATKGKDSVKYARMDPMRVQDQWNAPTARFTAIRRLLGARACVSVYVSV